MKYTCTDLKFTRKASVMSSYIFLDTAKFSSILGILPDIAPHTLLHHFQSTAREKRRQEAYYIPSNVSKTTPSPAPPRKRYIFSIKDAFQNHLSAWKDRRRKTSSIHSHIGERCNAKIGSMMVSCASLYQYFLQPPAHLQFRGISGLHPQVRVGPNKYIRQHQHKRM